MAERALSPPAHAAQGLAQNDAPQQDVDAVVKSVDMSDEKQKMAVQVAAEALGKYSVEKDAAMVIKKEFDRIFGSFVTHETKNFIYFYLGPIAVLLWKTS